MRGGRCEACTVSCTVTYRQKLFYSALGEKIKTVHYSKTACRTVTMEKRENMRVKKRASDSHLFPSFLLSHCSMKQSSNDSINPKASDYIVVLPR
jgi:hypothetical protein